MEVCPTGVFTDKTLKRHYTRKWDLQNAPGVCVHCAAGCNTLPGERYGTIRRIRNRYHSEINGYFICDRGRYGYEFTNSDRRITSAVSRLLAPSVSEGSMTPGRSRALHPSLTLGASNQTPSLASKSDALSRIADILKSGKAIGIGSPRASVEANFALRKLVGEENFFAGLSPSARASDVLIADLARGPIEIATIAQAEQSDCVLVLGEDVTNTMPRLALALRQAVPAKELRACRNVQGLQMGRCGRANARPG